MKAKAVPSSIKSPAKTNEDVAKNAAGSMPPTKDLDAIHKSLRPNSKLPGVSDCKSRGV